MNAARSSNGPLSATGTTAYDYEAFAESIGLPPYRRWHRFGWRSPSILFKRLESGHHSLFHPIFRLRMWRQRIRDGVSVEDCWGLDHHLARVIVIGVKRLRNWANGYPGELGSWEEWDAILARIEGGFQVWLDSDGWFHDKPEDEAKFKDAAGLLAHWFGALWD